MCWVTIGLCLDILGELFFLPVLFFLLLRFQPFFEECQQLLPPVHLLHLLFVRGTGQKISQSWLVCSSRARYHINNTETLIWLPRVSHFQYKWKKQCLFLAHLFICHLLLLILCDTSIFSFWQSQALAL